MQLILQAHSTRYLEISKAVNLGCAKEFLVKSVDVALLHLFVYVDDVLEFLKEPLVNLREFMNLFNSIALVHSL